MSQNEGKDFLDFELDDPLDSIQAETQENIAQTSQSVGSGVLVYEGKRYAVNLSWLVGDDSGNNALAIKRARDFGADFYCIRSNVVSQHGFAKLKQGHRIGMPVLASVVADVFVGEWHGVFVADNGWWYVAVHADNISPDGDLFFSSEEEAYNHFIEQGKLHRWPRSYAPISWNLNDATSEIPLNKIIGEAVAPVLKPVTVDAVFSGKTNKNLAVVAGFILGILLILGILGQQFLPSLIPQRLQAPSPNMNVADILQTPPQEPTLIAETHSLNLTNIPVISPVDFTRVCLEALSKISLSLPGWQLDTVRCREDFAEANWVHGSGITDLALPYLEDLAAPISYRFEGSGLLLQIPLNQQLLPKRSYALVPPEDILKTLDVRFLALGEYTLEDVVPPAAQTLLQNASLLHQVGTDSVLQNAPQLAILNTADLPFIRFSVTSSVPPNLLAPYFNIPGLIIEEIKGSITSGTWDYHSRIVPAPSKQLLDANTQLHVIQQKQR